MKQKNYSGSLEMKLFPYFLILPNLLIFVLFIATPAFFGFYFSLTEWNGINQPEFIAFANYAKAFGDHRFWTSFGRTCVYVVCTLPFMMVVPLFFANLMVKEIRCRSFFRAVFYWPSMISYIVIGLSFKFIFGNDTGIVNYLLTSFGLQRVEWMTQATTATVVLMVAHVWSRTGFFMVNYIAGLQSISPSLYEAAQIDGATKSQQFFRVTLPMLRPTTFLVMVLAMIDLFKVYALVISFTNGGPGGATRYVVQYIYEKAFREMNLGYASALSMLMLVIMAVITVVQFSVSKGGQVDG